MVMQDNSPNATLTAQQIETLQQLFRQFKSLGKRFNDSNIPPLIEKFAHSQPNIVGNEYNDRTQTKNGGSGQQLQADTTPKAAMGSARLNGGTTTAQLLQHPPQQLHGVSASTASPAASLSWQCYHSLLTIGIGKNAVEGSSSLMPAVSATFVVKVLL
jgi:hypothetical protein